jgi:hypothetical protein
MRTYDERDGNNRKTYYDQDDRAPRGGQRYRNGRSYERQEEPRYGGERQAPRPRTGQNMDLTEWAVAHEVKVKNIKVTIWLRQGRSGRDGRPIYSLTLTRTFQSNQRGGYLTTNKLFAEDAPLAAEAFRLAAEWLEQGGDEEPPPF